MNIRLLAATALLIMTTSTPGADAPGSPDTAFLKLYAETRGFMLGRPTKPKIAPDGKTVLFLRSGPKTAKNSLFEFDVASGKTRELLSPETLLKGADENLTPEEKARRERQRVSVGGFADYHLNPAGTHILVKLANSLFVFDRAANKAVELKTGKDGAIVDPKWSPDGKLISYVRGFDVYAYDLASEKESPVTTGGTQIKTHGLAEFVAQEEMGRHSGFWWSPDSKSIAYEEADHTGVEQWFVADPLKPEVPPAPQYYPRPGKKNVSVRLGVKKLSGGDTVWVEWDREQFEYLASVRWDPAGPLTVLLQDRAQRAPVLKRVNPAKGWTDSLVIELSPIPPSWIEIAAGGLPRWQTDGKGFLWVHASASGMVASILDAKGSPQNAAAFFSQDGLREIVGFDPGTGKTVAVVSRGTRLAERRITTTGERNSRDDLEKLDSTRTTLVIYRPNPQTGDSTWGQVLPAGEFPALGQVSAVFDEHLDQFALTYTGLEDMPQSAVYTRDAGLKRVGILPSVALEPGFKPNVTVAKVGDYWTAVVRPKNFDPKKKYPVIVDVYGGPKHLHVVQAMRNWLVPQWLADQGFIVVAVDNRGTPGRGAEWEKAIYKKFGTVPLEDQVKGLHALCDKFPELDRERVGIVGWSFGGYMAANGVLRRPDVFKAAVAGAPVTDWEDYDTHYTERYMGLLPESKAAYDEASLIPLAKDLKRPLLLVHGTADDNVYYRHSLKLADALFRAGRDFEQLALPGVTHMYSADPVVMERLWAKTAGYFKKHLGEVADGEPILEEKAELQVVLLRKACEVYFLNPKSGNKYPKALTDLVAPPWGGAAYLNNGVKDLVDPWGNTFKYESDRDGVYIWTERKVNGELKRIGRPQKKS